jgi:hypothetical protein
MEILPFKGIDTLHFCQSRSRVRDSLGSGYRIFRKAGSTDETDAYDSLGLHLYYDDKDELELIEAFVPASITFHGLEFLGRDLVDVENELKAIGFASERCQGGIQCDSAGIAIYAPHDIIEAISVFRRDYYDD